ncbi:Ig-like domain-containing protein [Inhella sp.]|uniref:Ig-like domain-containing protein n=1 Tax=Inhella sp. TaxID=1921806 RepID=UPI0035AEF0B9
MSLCAQIGLVRFAAAALLSAMVALGLTACGGGGGSAGTPAIGGGGVGNTDPAVVTVALSSTTVTTASPATVTVKLTTKAGAPIPGQVVSFTSSQQQARFSAQTALTDENGLATVQVFPLNSDSSGADAVIATTTVGGVLITGSTGFQMTATNVAIASFVSDVSTLAAYGQTTLSLQLSGVTSGVPVKVVASSACVAAGRATLTPADVTTTTGRAAFTYRDNGCGATSATDSIQVSVTGTTLTSALSLSLTSPTVSSVGFVSATPSTIFLKGSGYVENSNVKFKVNDANGNGVPEQLVEFELTTFSGGILLDGQTTKISKKTDANGEVIVRINAGTVPTPVRVKATLVGSTISTVSSSLAVAVGLPSQLNFSLSQGTINIEGYNYDGVANTYTIIASDRLGNPVPEGTAINFVAEAGQIQSTKLTAIANGLSSTTANYLSSEPRPLDGRVTLVAYALGEESFLDANGNNVYDANEDYQDLGDIFVDRLFNFGGEDPATVYTSGRFNPNVGYSNSQDQFVSLGLTGASACRSAVSPLLDLGVTIPVKPNSCNSGWGRAYVRRSIQTILSTSSARLLDFSFPVSGAPQGEGIELIHYYDGSDAPVKFTHRLAPGACISGLPQSGAISFTVADANPIAYNPMPAGTVITASATGKIKVSVAGGSPVPSTSKPTGGAVVFDFDVDSSGTIFISTVSPRGLGSTHSICVSKQ